MSSELVSINKSMRLYDEMANSIAKCFDVGHCKLVSQQAAGIAAYYKQIKDDESVRKFMLIKGRALRRIGEVFLSRVSWENCITRMDYIKKVKAEMADDVTVQDMNVSEFYHILEIMEVPEDFFEEKLAEHCRIGAVLAQYKNLLREQWEKSEAGQLHMKQMKKVDRQAKKRLQEEEQLERQEQDQIEQLKEASREAFAEVGITMDRRDREDMHQVVLLIKKPIHETLRQAAFDNRMTMQAILRQGLAMWLLANGYQVDSAHLVEPRNGDQKGMEKRA